MTAESFTFFTFTFFFTFFQFELEQTILLWVFLQPQKKGINVELTKRWTVTKCYKYSMQLC